MTSADTTPAARPVLPMVPAPLVTPRMPVLVVAAPSIGSISSQHGHTADGMLAAAREHLCLQTQSFSNCWDVILSSS